ncbi:dihydrolipoyl dehydrogenase [Mycoplasma bradburyae]|uniref:Dihydrolipoyl dehydrogenase n=1 Tax=Mycoplasma bradburyae TaxID=2963128 RepID=A0AAW6HP06_9MOLU|nr:dihydrolipoyl dehydrogenase [Mycoplasma bradburyae]MDC4182836.1 dihydrolipoyl dehydrogenase [Mycoplasma bradburyae]MDC4183510.1 dihydrolipoyl dehydrogenase [Mycoplasma bradburyae]UTS70594.1 dihydrolipoyl dehydrogenase [Mycoplasma bradburyae]
MYNYDVIVIGAGPGGYVAGEHAAKNGLKTLVIERGTYGGVCLNVGCIPTKALLQTAKVKHYISKSSEYGLDLANPNPTINWQNVLNRKNAVVNKLVNGVKTILKTAKAETIVGEAVIIDGHTVSVNNQYITAKNIIVATGSSPRKLSLPGFDQGRAEGVIIDSTRALELPQVPQSLVVIGGGVIGIEFASLYASLGTNVTILQAVDRLCETLDKDASDFMAKKMKSLGVNVVYNAKILGYQTGSIIYEDKGTAYQLPAQYILESVGRIVNDQVFGSFNVARDERGRIKLNDKLQTSCDSIYVIGDAAGQVLLAHYAYHHATYAVDIILGRKPKSVEPLMTPGCIYTYPEVSTIGYTEEQLKEKGIEYVVAKMPMAINGKAIADGSTDGFIKFMFGKKYGEVLGCVLIASTASDMISEIALAMENELTVFELEQAIHPHPTIAEVISECAKQAIYTHFNNKH